MRHSLTEQLGVLGTLADLRPLVPPVHDVGVLVVEVLPDGSKDVVPHGVRGSFGSLGNEADGVAEEQLQIDEVGDLEKRMQLVHTSHHRNWEGSLHGYLVARHQRKSGSGPAGAGNPSNSVHEELGLARKVEVDDVVLMAISIELWSLGVLVLLR